MGFGSVDLRADSTLAKKCCRQQNGNDVRNPWSFLE